VTVHRVEPLVHSVEAPISLQPGGIGGAGGGFGAAAGLTEGSALGYFLFFFPFIPFLHLLFFSFGFSALLRPLWPFRLADAR